jgi:hypothetical protein
VTTRGYTYTHNEIVHESWMEVSYWEVSIGWWRRFLLVSFVIQMGLYRVVRFGFCVA